MIKPSIPKNEKQRIKDLRNYEILDTLPEQNFDDLTKIAAAICGVPISLVSLVDTDRQWFKSHHGIDATETPRDLAFCAHAINESDEVLIVQDASKDERFFDNPLSVNEPNVVFYAGAPLVNSNGMALGTLCVIDHKPRELNHEQEDALKALARQVVSQLEYRKEVIARGKELKKRNREIEFISKASDLMELMIEAAPTGMLMANKDGKIVQVNSLVEEMFGYKKKELIGSTLEVLIPERFRVKHPGMRKSYFIEPMKRVMGSGRELYAKRKDGSEFAVEIGLNPVQTKEESFVLSSIVDITKSIEVRKELKEYAADLESANKELDQFAYIVSHDLKAPLLSISTLATFLAEDYQDKLDEDGKEQLSLLQNRVNRMGDIISGILDYSRVGRAKQEKVSVNFKELVRSIVDLIVPSSFDVTLKGEFPTLSIEKVLIAQIFQNLISNAVKYNDKEDGKITISVTEEANSWKFSVADNGPGIEEQYFGRIFEIFQTLQSRDTIDSTGIGLSIIKKTIDYWGGKVWVESEMGTGSIFYFTIPASN